MSVDDFTPIVAAIVVVAMPIGAVVWAYALLALFLL